MQKDKELLWLRLCAAFDNKCEELLLCAVERVFFYEVFDNCLWSLLLCSVGLTFDSEFGLFLFQISGCCVSPVFMKLFWPGVKLRYAVGWYSSFCFNVVQFFKCCLQFVHVQLLARFSCRFRTPDIIRYHKFCSQLVCINAKCCFFLCMFPFRSWVQFRYFFRVLKSPLI